MLIEMLRALICTIAMVIAVMAFLKADWRIYRTLASLFVIAIMTPEILNSVNAAATNISDVGAVRKVGWPTILAAVLVVWHARTWLADTTSSER